MLADLLTEWLMYHRKDLVDSKTNKISDVSTAGSNQSQCAVLPFTVRILTMCLIKLAHRIVGQCTCSYYSKFINNALLKLYVDPK